MSIVCTKCRLYKTSETSNKLYSCNKLMGSGNSSADVMFVGDWPGDDEIQKKTVFVGHYGQILKNSIKAIGLSADRCYFTYLCKCKPSYDQTPGRAEMNACLEYLKEEIEKVNPKIIVALGANVANTLGIKGSITNSHGQLFSYTITSKGGTNIEIPLLSIYHPAYINNFVENAKQRKDFAKDLGRVLRIVDGVESGKAKTADYRVAKSIEDVKGIVDQLLKAEWISYDSETTSLSCFEGKILLVSFSDGPGRGYIIPYEYPGIFNDQEKAAVKSELVRILGSNVKKIMQNGKFDIQFLFQAGIPIKAFAFDTMLAHYLLDENSPHGLSSTVPTYTDMGNYKDEVGEYITGSIKVPDGVDEKGREKTRPSTILDCPYEKLTLYAAQDADATFRLFKCFYPMLEKEGLLRLLVQIVNPVSYVLARMEYLGIGGDAEYVDEAVKRFDRELRDLEVVIEESRQVKAYLQKYNKSSPLRSLSLKKAGFDDKILLTRLVDHGYVDKETKIVPSTFKGLKQTFTSLFPEYTEEQMLVLEDLLYESRGRFNVNSVKQKSALFFDRDLMNLNPVKINRITEKMLLKGKKEGSPSVDAEALQKLFQENKIKVIDDILKYSKIKKFSEYVSNYQKILRESPDGRIHTSYNQCVTVTGRLSSSSPNLQNIPKHDKEKARVVRRTFIAKPGYTLVEADFSQIEFRIWGHSSGDERLLAVLKTGFDIHYQIAATILKLPVEKVTEDQRAAVKGVVYGMMYGRSNYSISKELGMEEQEVNRFVSGFFSMFPKAAAWMESNIEQMERLGYITNFVGRRRRALDIYSKRKELKESAQRQARNAPLQSGSADLIYQVMIKIYRDLLPYDATILMQIHDSLIFEIKDELLPVILPLVKQVMETTVQLTCPTTVGMEMGKNLAEMSRLRFTDSTIEIETIGQSGEKIYKPVYNIDRKGG